MTTTDPTPLAEQIAREHLALLNTSTWLIVGCTCDSTLTAPPSGAAGSWHAAHIATVTERAAREQVAEEIEGLAATLKGDPDRDVLVLALEDAARIANGAPDE